MKAWISILGGIVLGIILSYYFLDYNGWTIHQVGENGEITKTTRELDFDLITKAFLIILGISCTIFVVWTLIEKKLDKQ